MSDPSGSGPPFVVPSRLVLPTARTVHLDVNHWIALSQAATGHRKGAGLASVLEACRAAARSGEVVFPLSSATYAEVAEIRDPRQRADLARAMEELSRFATIIGHPTILTMELDEVISRRVGVVSRAADL